VVAPAPVEAGVVAADDVQRGSGNLLNTYQAIG
jgi:hypothetical protein